MPAGAGNQPVIYVGFKFHSEFGDNCSLDNVVVNPTPGALAVTLADNGTQVATAPVAPGATNVVLHKSSLSVSSGTVNLTGMTCTTAGSYVTGDLTNLKVYYSTSSTFSVGHLLFLVHMLRRE